jgi:hypothetical protein
MPDKARVSNSRPYAETFEHRLHARVQCFPGAMTWEPGALKERDARAVSRKRDGCGRTGGAATDDRYVDYVRGGKRHGSSSTLSTTVCGSAMTVIIFS